MRSLLSNGVRRVSARRAVSLARAGVAVAACAVGGAILLPAAAASAQDTLRTPPPPPTTPAPTPAPTPPPTPAPTPTVVVPTPALAPAEFARQFVITPRGGYVYFDRASSLKPGPAVGLDAQYTLTPSFSIGTNVTFVRSNTRGEDFLTTLTYGLVASGDTTFVFNVTQPVSVVDAQLAGMFRTPTLGRLSPFVTGGAGIYALYMDPEVNRGSSRYVRPSLMAGAGVDVRLSRSAGVRIDVRDQIFTSFDRERLRPSDERFRDALVLEGYPVPPAPKSTVNNFMFTFGFTFTPQGSDERTGPPREDAR